MALGPVMKMRMMMVMMVMMHGDNDEETTKNEQRSRNGQTVEEGGSCGAQMVSKNKWRWRRLRSRKSEQLSKYKARGSTDGE